MLEEFEMLLMERIKGIFTNAGEEDNDYEKQELR